MRDCSLCQNAGPHRKPFGGHLRAAFRELIEEAATTQKTEEQASPSSTTGSVRRKRSVARRRRLSRSKASNSESATYRATDSGLPEPEDLFRGCLTLRPCMGIAFVGHAEPRRSQRSNLAIGQLVGVMEVGKRQAGSKRPPLSASGRLDKRVIASHARDVDTNDSVRVER